MSVESVGRGYPLSSINVSTIIDVDDCQHKIKIQNYTNDLIKRAFGREEHPTYEDYEAFLESRCFPRERDKMKLMLQDLDLPFYDPFMIIEKTNGRMADPSVSDLKLKT